jgi:hypothetical protein
MKLRIELFGAFFMIFSSTWAQKIEERHQGNVYVLDKIVKDGKSDYSYNYPILALRIDSVLADTLHIKYLFGKESFLDADFLYGDSCNCYVSMSKILFSPEGIGTAFVNIRLDSDKNEVELFYNGDDSNISSYTFVFSYKDKMDRKTYRNVYYAEDGYKLFE